MSRLLKLVSLTSYTHGKFRPSRGQSNQNALLIFGVTRLDERINVEKEEKLAAASQRNKTRKVSFFIFISPFSTCRTLQNVQLSRMKLSLAILLIAVISATSSKKIRVRKDRVSLTFPSL